MSHETLLRVENLKKSFGGVNAVDGCSFAVERGTITALIGPNGAGKTTVFNLVSGFMRKDAGTIEFLGSRIDCLSAHHRARQGVARTFQQVRLFQNLSLKDNIAVAQETIDNSFWRSVFVPLSSWKGPRRGGGPIGSHEQRAGREDSIATLQNDIVGTKEALERIGIDRAPGTLASELSFGQQKLLELARALEFPHQLLMLDEPVAGVAPHLREQFLGLFRKLKAEGETILLIEHDMDFVMQLADTVVVMDEGKVLMEGTPEEVRRHEGVLEAYLGQQL